MQTRTFKISAIILVVFAVVCSRIPLFNYLGFESSALTVVITGFLSGLVLLVLWKQANPNSKADIWRFFGHTVITVFVIIAVPFLISLANALFVKNCSIGDGIKLYSLIVIPGTLFSISMALFSGIVFEKWRKTIFTIFYILVLLHIPLVTLLRPQIFAFNPIVGFFPGFTYDETLQVTQRLLMYRFATLAAAGCIVSGSVWIWQIRQNKLDDRNAWQHPLPIAELVGIALLSPIIVIAFALSDRFGLSSSEDFIRQKLAGNYRTEHFEIIYSAGSIKRERIEQIGKLHEFYFNQLLHDMNLNAQERIVSFLYAAPEQKGRLLGAANTDFAKPWLRQIHINLADVESALKHEMVHVLASDFGWTPLRIGRNSGLIEGIAMALERSSTIDEPLHQTAAMVFAAGIHPDVAALFSFSDFARVNPSISYNIVGSFCQFLIDKHGINRFKQVYLSGNFKDVYHQNLNTLVNEWKSAVDTIQITQNDSLKARYFFKRPSIFGKECARVLANLNSETRDLLDRHEYDKALANAELSLSLSKTPEAINRKTAALFELQKFLEVIEFVESQLQDSSVNFMLLPLRLRLGDAYWAIDSLAKAKKQYEFLSNIHLNGWYDDVCALRLESLKSLKESGELKIHFIYSMEDTIHIARLERLKSPAAKYLLAREYALKERFVESLQVLEKLGSMESKQLEFFRLYRIGTNRFRLQNYEKAKTAFEQSLEKAPNRYLIMETKEWIERCRFFSK